MRARRSSSQAQQAALQIADKLGYIGVLCVEFFILEDGSLVANEMAPRPHNSGHYTVDACATSQFEQQVRAMTGMPLGDTRQHSPAVMLNILGDVWFPDGGKRAAVTPPWHEVAAMPAARLHLYGKEEARPAARWVTSTSLLRRSKKPARLRAIARGCCIS